jgi:hypothetical protein
VQAPPDRVANAIARSVVPGGVLGFSVTDSTSAAFVGEVTNDGSFDLRRPRGFATAPRVAVVRGKIDAANEGAIVSVRYGLHPALLITRAAWLGFLALTAVIVIPASFGDLSLLWILIVFTFIVSLMLVPFEWLARADRAKLRTDLETTLRRAGATVLEHEP